MSGLTFDYEWEDPKGARGAGAPRYLGAADYPR